MLGQQIQKITFGGSKLSSISGEINWCGAFKELVHCTSWCHQFVHLLIIRHFIQNISECEKLLSASTPQSTKLWEIGGNTYKITTSGLQTAKASQLID
jgi:hypothetical protein